MGRNRIEDQFKEKLTDREITPSAGSWEKLSGQLKSEEKKEKPIIWWMGIAATVLGAILIAGIVYYSNPETNSPLVETPTEVKIENIKEPVIEEAIATEESIVTESSKKDVLPTQKKEKAPQPVTNLPENSLIAEAKKENLPVRREEVIAHDDGKISQKLEEIIAEVSRKEGVAGIPTNNEIDALLYKAASEISLERRNISSTGTVDAGDLLFAVEMELEESFREKVFDILKESYLKARTAVANRNY